MAIIYGYPPQSWRTESTFTFRLSPYQTNWIKFAGETRNYGAYSPVNGYSLSSQDEDFISDDCTLWNKSAYADPFAWSYAFSTPYAGQAQVRLFGQAQNPLESASGSITWDMNTQVNTSNLLNITARVNYYHTAYPAHTILIQNFVVYNYTPPSNDPVFIFISLVLQANKVIGSQSFDTQVPCN